MPTQQLVHDAYADARSKAHIFIQLKVYIRKSSLS